MSALREKALSWSLYHPTNQLILREVIEYALEDHVMEVIPICRELPVLLEVKEDYTIAGYATGWQVHRIDLIVLARAKSGDFLIAVEVKQRASINSLKQAMKYVAGILTTTIPKAHDPRGDIFQFYEEQVFSSKKAQNTLEQIKNRGNRRCVTLVALLVAEKFPKQLGKDSQALFTEGLMTLAEEYGVKLLETTRVARIENGDQLISQLAVSRGEEICRLYPDDEALSHAVKKALSEKKVIRFSTTEEGKAYLSLYPSGRVEIENGSRAHRSVNGRYVPLKILKALDEGSGGQFFLQFFLNGTNNPVFFLQIGKDEFLGFQHRVPYELHCNGIFNEYIAMDAKPVKTTPEAGDVICLANGHYFVSPVNCMKGLARRLTLIPDTLYPSRSDSLRSFSTLLIGPRVKKARHNNYVRPFLSNIEAMESLNSLTDEAQIFRFNRSDISFICNGLRIDS